MSTLGVSLKINVSKIDKARMFKGEKGTYLDVTVFLDPDNPDEYGNCGMLVQSVSKEERAQGVKGNILGNAKAFYTGDPQPPQQAPQQAPQQQAQQPQGQAFEDFDGDQDIPF